MERKPSHPNISSYLLSSICKTLRKRFSISFSSFATLNSRSFDFIGIQRDCAACTCPSKVSVRKELKNSRINLFVDPKNGSTIRCVGETLKYFRHSTTLTNEASFHSHTTFKPEYAILNSYPLNLDVPFNRLRSKAALNFS